MSHLIHKTTIAVGISFAVSLPAHAVDNLIVDGYAKSSLGQPVTSSSGECVRTGFKDTKELLESCGYKTVKKEEVAVDNQPAGVGVAVVEETAVVKSGEVLAAKEEIVAEAFVQNLAFEFNSADLTTSDRAKLDDVIRNLAPHRPLLRDNVAYLNVVGHTDSTGPEAYNQKLSERRAQSVADYLASVGEVRRERMRVSGRGETDPIADNNTDEGRQLNRRVVIEVIKQ